MAQPSPAAAARGARGDEGDEGDEEENDTDPAGRVVRTIALNKRTHKDLGGV